MDTTLMPKFRLARAKLEGNPRKRLRKLSQKKGGKSGSNLRMSPQGAGSIPKTRIRPSNLFRLLPCGRDPVAPDPDDRRGGFQFSTLEVKEGK